jgi:tight adherence protein B
MSRRVPRVAATAAALLLGLIAAPASATSASEGIAIDHIQVADDGDVSVLLDVSPELSVDGSDLKSVAVEVDGTSVDASAQPVHAGQVRRTTVLALDASDSMRGSRIEEAKAAAAAFLDAAPPDVRIGLLTFSGRVGDVIAPTTDRATLREAVDAITLTHGTRVYDAVVKAVNLAGDEGARSVVLLSDGQDQGGGTTLAAAGKAAHDADVSVDVVALDQAPAARQRLAPVSAVSGGSVVPASSPTALRAAFAAEADALSRQVLVSFDRPQDASREADLHVSLTVAGTTYDDTSLLTLPAAAEGPRAVESGGSTVGTPVLLGGAAAVGLALALAAAVLLLSRRGPTASQRRLAAYLGEAPADVDAASLKKSAVAWTSSVVPVDFETRLAQRLIGAGIALTAAEWILLHAGITVSAGVLGFVLGGGPMLVMGLIVGGLSPAVVLKVKHARRLAAFSAQLPDTLTMMSGGLSAGLSMTQAVDTVIQEGNEPMAGELRRALVEHRLGIGIEDALDGVANRMTSEDFGWVVMAMRIQREVGGNLAEILNTVAGTLREREYLRRQVKTLSAEGRLSAWILGALPVCMFTYMLVGNRAYVSLLWTTGMGVVMLAGAALLMASGAWVMSRLVKVEV